VKSLPKKQKIFLRETLKTPRFAEKDLFGDTRLRP
jgi:hypothetical protein